MRRIEAVVYELLWKQIFLPVRLELDHVDVVVYTYPNVSVISPKPSVIMIYDMLCHDEPSEKSFLNVMALAMLKLAAVRSKAIVTISNFSKERIVKYLRVRPEKVMVAYPGCPDVALNGTLPSCLREWLQSGGEFYLSVLGEFQPRKNAVTLLKAFAESLGKTQCPRKLVIIARQSGADWSEIKHILVQKTLRDRVIIMSPDSRDDLTEIYRHSRLLLHVTLYDGFGLPVLEAMSVGVPAIISDRAALPEVAAGCCLEVNPYDHKAIADAVALLDSDSELRERLRGAGRSRANQFTWESMARVLQSAIEMAKGLKRYDSR